MGNGLTVRAVSKRNPNFRAVTGRYESGIEMQVVKLPFFSESVYNWLLTFLQYGFVWRRAQGLVMVNAKYLSAREIPPQKTLRIQKINKRLRRSVCTSLNALADAGASFGVNSESTSYMRYFVDASSTTEESNW